MGGNVINSSSNSIMVLLLLCWVFLAAELSLQFTTEWDCQTSDRPGRSVRPGLTGLAVSQTSQTDHPDLSDVW